MPNINTYERNPAAQQLGGTTRLSASVDAGGPMKAVAGALGAGAQVMQQRKQEKDALEKKAQDIKNQGKLDQLEVDRQRMLNRSNKDFADAHTVAEGHEGPTMPIEEKPDFMRKRSEDWEADVKGSSDLDPAILNSFLLNTQLRTEREQAGYQSQVNAFQLERAVVSKQMVYNQSVQNGDFEAMTYHYDALEQMVGPAKASSMATQAQQGYFNENFVALSDTEGLDNAYASLNDPSIREGFDFIDDAYITKAKKANRQQKAYVERGIADAQRDNLYKAQEDIANNVYNPIQLEAGKVQGKQVTSLQEPAGYDARSARIIEDMLQEKLIEEVPQEAWNIREEAAAELTSDFSNFWQKKRTEKLETLMESKKHFFDRLDEMEGLSANDRYAMTMEWANSFKAEANPSLHAVVTDEIVKNWKLSAKLIAAGHKDVVMGGGLDSLLMTLTGKETPSQFKDSVAEINSSYEGMLSDVVKTEIGSRDVSQFSMLFPSVSSDEEYDNLPSGTPFIDPEGNQRTKQ